MNTTTETTVETPETSPQMPATPRSTPEPTPTQPETQPEPEQSSTAPAPEPVKGKTKAKKELTIKNKRARRTPTIDDFPELSSKEKMLLQGYLLTPITYKEQGGRRRYVSTRRKVYAWLRLKGWKHTDALRKAGFTIYTSETYILHRSKAGKALKTYWNINHINLEYLLDRLITLVQEGKNENARVRAVKLISELKGYYSTRHVIDVNETMQVQFSMSGPAICPHCHHSTIEGPGQPALPAVIQDALSVGSGGE